MPPLVLGSILKSAPGWKRGCFALRELVAVFATASPSVKHCPAQGSTTACEGAGGRLGPLIGSFPTLPTHCSLSV